MTSKGRASASSRLIGTPLHKQYCPFVIGFLRTHRIIILAAFLLFILSIPLGMIAPPDVKQELVGSLLERIEEVLTPHEGLLFLRIFMNNAGVGLLMFLLGIFLLPSALMLIGNGAIIGIVIGLRPRIILLSQRDTFAFYLSIIPHGVLELPAIILCAALGGVLGIKLFFRRKYCPTLSRRHVLRSSLLFFVIFIIPLLLVAAFIETFVTSRVVDLVTDAPQNDADIERMLIGDADVAPLLGLHESPELFEESRGMPGAKLAQAILFNDTVFAYARTTVERPFAERSFSGESLSLYVIVRQYPNKAEAMHALRAQYEIVDSLLGQEALFIPSPAERPSDGYEIVREDKDSHSITSTRGAYVVHIQGKGIEQEALASLLDLQLSRLQ